MSQTENTDFKKVTKADFTEQNQGQDYLLPFLTSQLCKIKIRNADGEVIAKGESATNESIELPFEEGAQYEMTISETKGEQNKLKMAYGDAPFDGTVKWKIIIDPRGMLMNCKTLEG